MESLPQHREHAIALQELQVQTTAEEITRFRRDVISLHLAFADLRPQMHRARLLALNGEVLAAHLGHQGAPYGVVLRELASMIHVLEELIGELEGAFQALAHEVARWIRSEDAFRLCGAALEQMGEGAVIPERQGRSRTEVAQELLLVPGVEAHWRARRDRHEERASIRIMWNRLLGFRQDAMRNLGQVADYTRQVAGVVERIRWLASRQSQFISISASIEAARYTDDNGSLQDSADDIRKLAADIAGMEERARHRIEHLLSLGEALCEPVQHELAHV